jgi:transcriptional/translational regulatory protein YebC/TACO1
LLLFYTILRKSGLFVFEKEDISVEEVEETLILSDIDVWEISEEEGKIQVIVNPMAYGKTRDLLYELGVKEFTIAELRLIPDSTKKISEENKEEFMRLLDLLDDVEDVQDVYHDIELD